MNGGEDREDIRYEKTKNGYSNISYIWPQSQSNNTFSIMTDQKKGKTGQTKKPSVIRRFVRLLFKILLAIILLLFLSLLGINIYLQSNKTKIFDNLPFLNHGSVSFGAANISVFQDFPLATISLKNITLQDSLIIQHQQPFLKIGNLRAAADLQKILDYQIEIHSIGLEDGAINMFTDSSEYNNFKSLFLGKKDLPKNQWINRFQVLTDNLGVSFKNIDFHFTDAIKTTSIQSHIENLSTNLHISGEKLSAEIDMSLNVEELSFNKEEGSFASNSHLSGKFKMELKDGNILFPPFDLKINDEHFLFSGNFDTQKKNKSTLVFENDKTGFTESVKLLSAPVQKALKPFQIDNPFYSKTTISGYFKPNDLPIVNVEFNFKNNIVKTGGHIFNNTRLNGNFKNRLYGDERNPNKINGQIKIQLNNLNADHDGFHIFSKNTLITSSKNKGPQLKADLKVNGQPSGISKWFDNDQFFFQKGHFELIAYVQGPLNNYNQLVIESEAQMALNDFSVIYRPADTSFPFDELSLIKEKGETEFTIVNGTFQNGHGFRVDGGMKNLPALLFKLAERASSNAVFVAPKISWSDFLNFFGEKGYLKNNGPKTDHQKKKSMKETIQGIQFNFQPRLSVLVDTLQYFDLLELHDFKTGVHFENEHTVALEKTSFKYGEADVDFQIKMDISDPERTPFEFELHTQKLNLQKLLPPFDYFKIKLLADIEHLPDNVSIDIRHKGILDDQNGLIPNTSTGEIIFKVDEGETILGKIVYEPGLSTDENNIGNTGPTKTKIALEGKPIVFNEFFKTDKFFFDEGRFFVQFEYEGKVSNFEELLNKGNATFTMQNSEVYYKLADVTFPLTQIDLDIRNDNADFYLFLKSDSLQQQINFTGNIQNLSELILENTGKHLKTTVEITSPKIKWQQFLDIFSNNNAEKNTSVDALKATVKGMLKTFDPNIHVQLDTFIYSDKLTLHKVETGIQLQDTATLLLEKTGFDFYDGSMSVNGIFDLGVKDAAPFTAHFETDELDIAKLVESLNYLYLPSLKELEKLSGQATMNLGLSGIIANDAKGLVSEANDGTLDFELRNIIIKGFEPLDKIAAKLKMQKRFKEIRFEPINNRLEIKGNDLYIPLMEIQSNAINMFVEGTLSYGDNTNIWVSVPVDNLKKADRSIIPEKRGYAATRRKIYIEVTTDKNEENRFKFRNTKRKFYKQRGILEQYKLDKRRYREIRKAMKD